MYAIWDVKSSLGKREEAEGVCDLGCQVKSRLSGGSGGCMRSGMSGHVKAIGRKRRVYAIWERE